MLSESRTKQAGHFPRDWKQTWADNVMSTWEIHYQAKMYMHTSLACPPCRRIKVFITNVLQTNSSGERKTRKWCPLWIINYFAWTIKCIRKHVLIHHISITAHVPRTSCLAKICIYEPKYHIVTSLSQTLPQWESFLHDHNQKTPNKGAHSSWGDERCSSVSRRGSGGGSGSSRGGGLALCRGKIC